MGMHDRWLRFVRTIGVSIFLVLFNLFVFFVNVDVVWLYGTSLARAIDALSGADGTEPFTLPTLSAAVGPFVATMFTVLWECASSSTG